jgi:hypothetical protein
MTFRRTCGGEDGSDEPAVDMDEAEAPIDEGAWSLNPLSTHNVRERGNSAMDLNPADAFVPL